MIEIILNGLPRQVKAGTTLSDLIAEIDAAPRGIAIERNREIVPKSEHPHVVLSAGDQLEVVQFVGGG